MHQKLVTKPTESDNVTESNIMHQNKLTKQAESDKVTESDMPQNLFT